MSISYLTQQSTLNAVLPSVIPAAQQQQNQFSSIITDITNLYQMMNNNIIPAANSSTNTLANPNTANGAVVLNANTWMDFTGNTQIVLNGGTINFPNFSGMIIINNWINGCVTLWLCGSGGTSALGNTGTPFGTLGWNSGIGGYTWTNTSGITIKVAICAIMTRPTA